MFGSDYSSITITNNIFTGNRVHQGGGGAIGVVGMDTTVTISYSNFTNNSAVKGGVLSSIDQRLVNRYYNNITLDITVSVFLNNEAHIAGGVLSTENSYVSVTQSTYLANRANDGGTMYIQGGSVTINCSGFYHNMARFGGVLWAKQAILEAYDIHDETQE